jgi:arginase
MSKPLAFIGAPTSAGAFAPGQEQAPRVLRDAGLIESLTGAGLEVVDLGDGPVWRWRPDHTNRFAQNLDAVVQNAQDVASRVRHAVSAGLIPLILGGDCTIELGTVAGHLPSDERIGLVYFDLHPDLNVPESVPDGALDWMGMAHLLGEDQAAESLSHLGPRFPLLDAEAVLFFSYGPKQATSWERAVMERRGLRGIPVDTVASAPEKAAEAALAELEPRIDRLLIHFDVDTVDFTDTPLSENTGRNQGLSFDAAFRALRVLVNSERFSALTVTELNPAHGDEHGATVRVFIEALTDALVGAPALRRRSAHPHPRPFSREAGEG